LFGQKSSADRTDDRSSQPTSSQTADLTTTSSAHDEVVSGERQQHGALPDLLPPQIPPRANQLDKTTSEEVNIVDEFIWQIIVSVMAGSATVFSVVVLIYIYLVVVQKYHTLSKQFI